MGNPGHCVFDVWPPESFSSSVNQTHVPNKIVPETRERIYNIPSTMSGNSSCLVTKTISMVLIYQHAKNISLTFS